MRLAFALALALVAWVIAFGSPLAPELPELGHYYESPHPILPMRFAHTDHATVGCLDCHHNYVDDTGDGLCMNCHVTHADVAGLLEQQFHTLCRDCHTQLAADQQPGGPTRQCIGCHLADTAP